MCIRDRYLYLWHVYVHVIKVEGTVNKTIAKRGATAMEVKRMKEDREKAEQEKKRQEKQLEKIVADEDSTMGR